MWKDARHFRCRNTDLTQSCAARPRPWMQSTHCTPTALPLHSHCTPTALSLHSHLRGAAEAVDEVWQQVERRGRVEPPRAWHMHGERQRGAGGERAAAHADHLVQVRVCHVPHPPDPLVVAAGQERGVVQEPVPATAWP
jgi:hypothetical protein